MDISQILRDEIKRQAYSVTEISKGTGLPFSTVSEFMRGVRVLGTDKTGKIAELLGFELTLREQTGVGRFRRYGQPYGQFREEVVN